MKSSSIHTLNADKGLNFVQKFLYFGLNFINNLFSYINVDKRIVFHKFESPNWRDYWNEDYSNSSISRKTSDIFWRSVPWLSVSQELGEIHVFDTGCGSGNYGLRLLQASGGRVKSYVGVDAKEKSNWQELMSNHQNFKLIRSTSSDIRPLIPKETNFFISQTAIEHFDEDLLYFEHLKDFIDKSNKPSIQIHVFPAVATLPLYLFHGLRQYNPRNISKITRIFGGNSKFTLVGLGGRRGKWLHFKYFTWPVLILRRFSRPTFDEKIYNQELYKAFESDLNTSSRSPLFWALIIESNTKNSIFKSA